MNPFVGVSPSGIHASSSSIPRQQHQPPVHSSTVSSNTSESTINGGASNQANAGANTVKYPVYLNVDDKKSYNILKFSTPVDFSKWTQVTASRDLSVKKILESQSSLADEMPEFGAGSEYGRKAREQAWRQRRGMALAKKVSVKDLPIKFKTGENKQYIGKKEGGVDEHSSYFIMCLNQAPKQANQSGDGVPQGSSVPQGSLPASMNVDSFQLLPVNAWFSASTAVTYKTLDDEEAEEEFSRRDKILNHFSLMLQKRLKDEQAEEEGEEGSTTNAGLGRLNPSEMNLNSMVQASVSVGSGSANALMKKLSGGPASSAAASKVYYKNSLKNQSALKISDYDEDYMSSSDEDEAESGGDGEDENGEGGSKKKKKKSKKNADEDEKPKVVGGKKKQKDEDATNREENEEIEEESDDGEFEGLELDYNEAESSPSEEEVEEENEQVADDKKAVPEELDKVLEEEDLEDEDQEDEEGNEGEKDGEGGGSEGGKGGTKDSVLSSKSDSKKRKGIATSGADESSDEEMDSSSDEDPDQMTSVLFLSNTKKSGSAVEGGAEDPKGDVSKAGTSSEGIAMTEKQKKTADILSNVKAELSSSKSGKRKAEGGGKESSKKQKIDPAKGDAFEALITKYCQRKATSTGELLIKLRKLRPDMDKDEIVKKMVATMKNLGLKSKKVGGKTLWSMQ